MSKNKKIAVLGTGANGSCSAADLTRFGYDVTLIDQWPEHVDAMNQDGLTIQMPEEEINIKVKAYHLCKLCELNIKFDIVLLYVKAYDSVWMTELIKPYLADDGIMVGVQNAMTAEDISNIVGSHRTLGCVIELSSELFTPGIIQRDTPPARTWFGIGAFTADMEPRLKEIEEILSNIGNVTILENILSAKWMKLIVNAMCMAPFAMLGVNLTEGFKIPGMKELIMEIGSEALLAGQGQGYNIEPIFGLKEEDIKGSNNPLELILNKLIKDIGPNARDAVFHDHLKGRYSEADTINGLVVEKAKEKGNTAPLNNAVVEITKKIFSKEIKPDIKNLELLKEYIKQS